MKTTIVEYPDYLKDPEPKFALFRKIMEQAPGLEPSGLKVVDLGAGHCRYTNICAEAGFDTTAVDARTVRVPKLHPNARFKQANVLKLKREFFWEYDVILCLGLLYHLTASEALLLLKRCNQAEMVIVDTHFCDDRLAMDVDSGYKGLFYKEAPNVPAMMANPRASVSTLRSFWPSYTEQLRMFEDAGFSECLEIRPYHHPFRTFFVLR